MGLGDSRQISSIVIHPSKPDTVYVAAMGYEWGRNAERGIFKTTDGGRNWKKILYVNDTAGFIDLQADPKNPEVLYAAAWQRFRFGGGDMAESGPESGIYKTIDGGRTGRSQHGLPKGTKARSPLRWRATIQNSLCGNPTVSGAGGKRTIDTGGIFRSVDGVNSWQRMNPTMTRLLLRSHQRGSGDDIAFGCRFRLMVQQWRQDVVKANMKHVHNDLTGSGSIRRSAPLL